MILLFQDLKIGDKFHTGKSTGSGFNKNIVSWMEFEKIDKSHARVIRQVNYGNTRLENTIQPFSANSNVWSIIDNGK